MDIGTSLEALYRAVPAAEEEDLLEQVGDEQRQALIRDVAWLYDDLVLPCYRCGTLTMDLGADGTCEPCKVSAEGE